MASKATWPGSRAETKGRGRGDLRVTLRPDTMKILKARANGMRFGDFLVLFMNFVQSACGALGERDALADLMEPLLAELAPAFQALERDGVARRQEGSFYGLVAILDELAELLQRWTQKTPTARLMGVSMREGCSLRAKYATQFQRLQKMLYQHLARLGFRVVKKKGSLRRSISLSEVIDDDDKDAQGKAAPADAAQPLGSPTFVPRPSEDGFGVARQACLTSPRNPAEQKPGGAEDLVSTRLTDLGDAFEGRTPRRRQVHRATTIAGSHNLGPRHPLVGRSLLIQAVLSYLEEPGRVACLSGAAGMGKSTVAKEVARHFHDVTRLAWVLPAGTRHTLVQGYRRFAERLGVDVATNDDGQQRYASDADRMMSAIVRELSSREGLDWLIVLDNAPETEAGKLPPWLAHAFRSRGKGRMLVTTRSRNLRGNLLGNQGTWVEPFEAAPLGPLDGVSVLQLGARRHESLSDEEARAAMRICSLVGGSPQLLKCARSVVQAAKPTLGSFRAYLAFLEAGEADGAGRQETVAARVLTAHFDAVAMLEETGKAEGLAQLVGVVLALGPDQLPRSMLCLATGLQSAPKDAVKIGNAAVDRLYELGLLEKAGYNEHDGEAAEGGLDAEEYFSMHHLLHAAGRQAGLHAPQLATMVMAKALMAFDTEREETWRIARDLDVHVTVLERDILGEAGSPKEASGGQDVDRSLRALFANRVMRPRGQYLSRVAWDLDAAEWWVRATSAALQTAARGDDPDAKEALARSLEELAWIKVDQDDLQGAEAAFTESLEQLRALYGDEPNEHVAERLRFLGGVKRLQQDLDGAEAFYNRSLTMLRKVHGPEAQHPDLAIALRALGNVKFGRKDFEGAEAMFTEALAMVRGADTGLAADKEVVDTLRALGVVKRQRKDLEGAAAMYTEALSKLRELHGTEGNARETAMVLRDLGNVKFWRRDLRGAEELYSKAAAKLRSVGSEDSKGRALAGVLRSLGSVQRTLTNFRGAEASYTEVVEVLRRVHGEAAVHKDLAMAWRHLGHARFGRVDLPGAEAAYAASARILRALNEDGACDADVIDALRTLGVIKERRRDLGGAEACFAEALALIRGSQGEDVVSMDAVHLLRTLGAVKRQKGELADAEALFAESLAMIRTIYGADAQQKEIAEMLRSLASLKRQQRDLEGAETLYTEALGMLRAIHGANARRKDIADGLRTLAVVKQKRGDAAGAEARYIEALAMLRAVYGADVQNKEMDDLARRIDTLRREGTRPEKKRTASAETSDGVGDIVPKVADGEEQEGAAPPAQEEVLVEVSTPEGRELAAPSGAAEDPYQHAWAKFTVGAALLVPTLSMYLWSYNFPSLIPA